MRAGAEAKGGNEKGKGAIQKLASRELCPQTWW